MRRALRDAGWRVEPPINRDGDPTGAAQGVALLVLAVPDGAVSEVAARVAPGDAVVAHLAGSLGTGALGPHRHRGALHPLVALPSPELGAPALTGAWWGVAASSAEARRVVDLVIGDLAGTAVSVADRARAAYHAAAVVAANHLVALMAQVEAIAALAGLPLDAYAALAGGALANVAALGPAGALTGPVARGDWATVAAHRAAVPPEELDAYDALSRRAARLVGRPWDVR